MCIYTLERQKCLKFFFNYSGGGVRDSPKRPKIERLQRKGYREN